MFLKRSSVSWLGEHELSRNGRTTLPTPKFDRPRQPYCCIGRCSGRRINCLARDSNPTGRDRPFVAISTIVFFDRAPLAVSCWGLLKSSEDGLFSLPPAIDDGPTSCRSCQSAFNRNPRSACKKGSDSILMKCGCRFALVSPRNQHRAPSPPTSRPRPAWL